MLKYNAITEMLSKGKEAYNACMKDMKSAREAGAKGIWFRYRSAARRSARSLRNNDLLLMGDLL